MPCHIGRNRIGENCPASQYALGKREIHGRSKIMM